MKICALLLLTLFTGCRKDDIIIGFVIMPLVALALFAVFVGVAQYINEVKAKKDWQRLGWFSGEIRRRIQRTHEPCQNCLQIALTVASYGIPHKEVQASEDFKVAHANALNYQVETQRLIAEYRSLAHRFSQVVPEYVDFHLRTNAAIDGCAKCVVGMGMLKTHECFVCQSFEGR